MGDFGYLYYSGNLTCAVQKQSHFQNIQTIQNTRITIKQNPSVFPKGCVKTLDFLELLEKLEPFAWFLMGELWIFILFWKSHICYTETVTFPKHPCCPHNSPPPPHPYIDVLYIPSRRKSFLTFQIESHLNESPEVSR